MRYVQVRYDWLKEMLHEGLPARVDGPHVEKESVARDFPGYGFVSRDCRPSAWNEQAQRIARQFDTPVNVLCYREVSVAPFFKASAARIFAMTL